MKVYRFNVAGFIAQIADDGNEDITIIFAQQSPDDEIRRLAKMRRQDILESQQERLQDLARAMQRYPEHFQEKNIPEDLLKRLQVRLALAAL